MPTATDRMKRWLIGLAAALTLASPAAAQTLTSSCYVAYPANTTSRLCTALDSLVASDAGKQPLDADLTSLAGATGTGQLYYRSAASTWSPVTVGTGLSFTTGTLTSSGSGGTVTSVGLISTDLTVSGSPVTGAGNITANLANTAVTAGSYGSTSVIPGYTVDAKGRLTAVTTYTVTPASIGAQVAGTYATGTGSATNTNTGDETAATIRTKLGITTLSGSNTGDQSFTASGDATAPSSTSNLALTFATVNANVGSFGSGTAAPVVTINAKGLVTAASTAAITAAGIGAQPAFTSQSAALFYASPSGVAGVPSFRSIVTTDLPTLLTAGSVGSTSAVPVLTYNAQGEITAATTAALGTAAVQSIGTSGATVPLLSTANTWTLAQTFTASPILPTPTYPDSTTKGATTAFVSANFAPLVSPALTGTPTAPTAAAGTSTAQIATTAYVATNFLADANNLSELANKATARSNLLAQQAQVATGTGSDSNLTYAVAANGTTYFFSTPLTVARIFNLSATGAYDGLTVRVIFTSTGGFTLTVRDATVTTNAKALAVNTWCDFTYSTTAGAWRQTAYGSL